MLKQIKYFQSVVEEKSFTNAADANFISQSAISQQIHSLENELGVKLLERKNRGFTLTAAGLYFYEKTLPLVAKLNQVCQETRFIAKEQAAHLSIGYLYSYEGSEIQEAIASFARKFPDAALSVRTGTHDELYDDLRLGRVDMVINDQRRAFSPEYENLALADLPLSIECAVFNPLAGEDQAVIGKLKDKPLILVASSQQEETERSYYRDVLGFRGTFRFTASPMDAQMLAVANRGYLPLEIGANPVIPHTLACLPVYKQGKPIMRKLCAFWKKDQTNSYVDDMAEILTKTFTNYK